MKKVFLSLAVVALLAACGAEKASTQEVTNDSISAPAADSIVEAPVEAPADTTPAVEVEDTTLAVEDTNAVEEVEAPEAE